MTAYRELIERLERAIGPDREIDVRLAYVADYAMEDFSLRERVDRIGFDAMAEKVQNSHNSVWRLLPAYTASIDAALSLVEKMLPGWKWRVEPDFASVFDADGDWTRYEEASDCKSAPLAICLALLRALEAQSKDKEEGE